MNTTAIKYWPILFKGEMVRAILEGRKTETRRIIKLPSWSTKNWDDFETDGQEAQIICANTGCLAAIPCPYGKVGDRLWVKETWYQGVEKLWYKADIEDLSQCGISGWRASIHMSRKNSRITLEVTDVRVQRLQEISEEDAICEGIGEQVNLKTGERRYGLEDLWSQESSIDAFRIIWDSINRKTHPWQSNPWLWCVSFKVVDNAIAQQEVEV